MTQIKQLSPVLELKGIDDSGTFAGYASVFAVTDSHKERTVPGSFGMSLADHKRRGSRPKMFWQHDPREPIGKWVDLAEDGRGLYVEGKLNMGVQRAREAYELLKEGDIDGLSIGYYAEDTEPDPKRAGVTLLKRINLVEVSIVSMGSNSAALIDSVKSEYYAQLREKLLAGEPPTERELERGLRDAFQLSRAEAERAVRSCFATSRGELGHAPDTDALQAIAALRDALKSFA
jgi:uncharacterized protein